MPKSKDPTPPPSTELVAPAKGKGKYKDKRTTFWHDNWLKEYANTTNVSKACGAAGVSRETVYKHRRWFAEFARQWDEIREGHTDEIEEVAITRAIDGKSDAIIMFMLERRRPEVYRSKQEITLEKMTNEQLIEFITQPVASSGSPKKEGD